MYRDDTYLETEKFVIERPVRQDDLDAHPNKHAAFLAIIAPVTPAPAEPAPVNTAVSG